MERQIWEVRGNVPAPVLKSVLDGRKIVYKKRKYVDEECIFERRIRMAQLQSALVARKPVNQEEWYNTSESDPRPAETLVKNSGLAVLQVLVR
jgi:hypothetical protein